MFFRILIALLCIVPVQSFAFEAGCFTESAKLELKGSSPIFVATDRRNDLFFTQNNAIIPFKHKPTQLRGSQKYTISSSLSSFPIDKIGLLVDDLPSTVIEIDPIKTGDGFAVTLSFDSIIQKNTIIPNFDIVASTELILEISLDNRNFAKIGWSDVSKYDFKFLRITVSKNKGIQTSTIFRTLRFDLANQDIFILEGINPNIPIQVYRGWVCASQRLQVLQAELSMKSKDINIAISTGEIVSPKFSSVTISGKDSDGDSVIDMYDNCPTIPNLDQKDRNYDGRGDVCMDDDADGKYGETDNCPTIPNLDQKDLNNNMIGDACEFDFDKDGIMDGIDNCRTQNNLDQKDADNDGIGDVCDNCKITNPDQLDINNNAIGDVCDIQDEYNKKNDTDKDGILDFSDNCRSIYNPDQGDIDTDGVGNSCDSCNSIKNPDQKDDNKNGIGDACEDADKDGFDGWMDNCPIFTNPDQKDSNNDGIGDSCTDTDGDKLYNNNDNCPSVYNPDQKDTDTDGVGNSCDQKDDRLIESNKNVFMILFGCISIFFIAGIVYFFRKLKF